MGIISQFEFVNVGPYRTRWHASRIASRPYLCQRCAHIIRNDWGLGVRAVLLTVPKIWANIWLGGRLYMGLPVAAGTCTHQTVDRIQARTKDAVHINLNMAWCLLCCKWQHAGNGPKWKLRKGPLSKIWLNTPGHIIPAGQRCVLGRCSPPTSGPAGGSTEDVYDSNCCSQADPVLHCVL
jgi:hypothetical protein